MPEVSIGSNDYAVLADLDYADEYLAGDVSRATVWALKNEEARGRGLVSASRMLLALPWCEGKRPDPEADHIDPVIQEVAAMLAADLVAKPKLFADASGNSNVQSAKAGSAQVTFFAPVEGGPPLPRALWDRLLSAGLVSAPGGADDITNAGALFSGTDYDCRPEKGRFADYCRDGWLAKDTD